MYQYGGLHISVVRAQPYLREHMGQQRKPSLSVWLGPLLYYIRVLRAYVKVSKCVNHRDPTGLNTPAIRKNSFAVTLASSSEKFSSRFYTQPEDKVLPFNDSNFKPRLFATLSFVIILAVFL